MATRPSSLTLFDRATPEQRAEIRRKSLTIQCPDCKEPAGHACTGLNAKPAKPHYSRQVRSGARAPAAAPKTAAEEALDDIAKLSGIPQWDYPGQLVRDVKTMRAHLLALIGPDAERLALDMDHHCRDHARWWKAVEKARKFLLYTPPKKGASR